MSATATDTSVNQSVTYTSEVASTQQEDEKSQSSMVFEDEKIPNTRPEEPPPPTISIPHPP